MKLLFILLSLLPQPGSAQLHLVDSVIKVSALQQTVGFLSHDSLRGRLTGSKGADDAAAYLTRQFDSIGLKPWPGNVNFSDPYVARYHGKDIPAQNVVGTLPGSSDSDTIVVFSAHYDHVGQRNDLSYNQGYSRKDDIFNGANDNATGVAALVELARYYKQLNNNRYTLVFAAFSGEEMEMLGSTDLVKRLKGSTIKASVNLEMLGRPDKNKCFIIAFNTRKIRNQLNAYLKEQPNGSEKDFFIADPYPNEDLVYRSDHYPFAQKINTAFTIMATSPADKFYHSVDDEYNTIDFDFLLSATKKIALACELFTR